MWFELILNGLSTRVRILSKHGLWDKARIKWNVDNGFQLEFESEFFPREKWVLS